MQRLTIYAAALAALLAVPIGGHCEESTKGGISVDQPWSRATPGGAQVAAGYFIIKNSASTPDRLMSASAEIAGHAEIHQMSMGGGMMIMRQLKDGVVIPAQGSVTFDPDSYHLMFMDLKRPLKEGETFKGTLVFEAAGAVGVVFDVAGQGATAPPSQGH